VEVGNAVVIRVRKISRNDGVGEFLCGKVKVLPRYSGAQAEEHHIRIFSVIDEWIPVVLIIRVYFLVPLTLGAVTG